MGLHVETGTPWGTKVFDGKIFLKRIPKKYADVIKPKHILNRTVKRLTEEERFLLEVALLEYDMKIEYPRIYDLIKRSKPKAAQKVKIFGGGVRYELVYGNGTRIKVKYQLFWLAPKRLPEKHSNY